MKSLLGALPTCSGITFVLVTAPSLAADTFKVTTTADSGPGSLRQAIDDANANSGTDAVVFALVGSNPHRISPLSPLSSVTDPVVVDATTQPGYVGSPVVELDGSSTIDATALHVLAGSTTVRGLSIIGWRDGIVLDGGSGSVIVANHVGLVAAGTTAAPNVDGILVIGSSDNRIGGPTAADRNVVSGNLGTGIFLGVHGIPAPRNMVQGNYVGTDRTGSVAIGNFTGISCNSADNLFLANLLSGNQGDGLGIGGPGATGNVIQRNLAGTDVTGMTALPNNVGISLNSDGNLLGGGATNRNVASGNIVAGIWIGGGSTANRVLDNYVGTDPAGITTVPNGNGINMDYSPFGNLVAHNLVAGSTYSGIFCAGAGGNVFESNRIVGSGRDGIMTWAGEDGAQILRNVVIGSGQNGIAILGSRCVVVGNDVHGNGNTGIQVNCVSGLPAGHGNSVLRNSIDGNGALGIDLTDDCYGIGNGVDPNDAGDVDGGANGHQNYPLLTRVRVITGGTRIQGVLESRPLSRYYLEFFATTSADPSGHGEGAQLVGFLTVQTNTGGSVRFDATVPSRVLSGRYVTATATDGAGSTSEFAAAFLVP